MSNLCYIKTRKKLTPFQVETDIKQVLSRHFGDIVSVERAVFYPDGKTPVECKSQWDMSTATKSFIFGCWLETPHCIAVKSAGGLWEQWAEYVFRQSLGRKYNAKLSSEDSAIGSWKPRLKYKTFRDFVEWSFPASKKRGIINDIYDQFSRSAPMLQLLSCRKGKCKNILSTGKQSKKLRSV